jgi:hypothetical protein
MSERGQRSGMHFVSDLGDAMRRNPVSTALIGMGLLWLFTGDRVSRRASGLAHKAGLGRVPDVASDALETGRAAVREGIDRVGQQFADVGERLTEAGESAAAAASDLARAARQRGAEAIDRAAEIGRAAPETGAELFDSARSRLTEIFNEQPLLLGAIGVAIGAGIAASLPATETEAELFGEASDELKSQARGFAWRATERAGMAAWQAAGAAVDEAKRQGLTPEGMMAAAREVGDKAKRVAEAAEDNVRLE